MLRSIQAKLCSIDALNGSWTPARCPQIAIRAIYTRIGRPFQVCSEARKLSRQVSSTGLFSIPELQEPSDFPRLAQNAIKLCNSTRTDIASAVAVGPSNTSSTNPTELLTQLDDISKHVCNVIDAAELCRSVHADAAWRECAQAAFQTLSDYMGHLNSDRNLYLALQLVMKNPDQLSVEDRTFAKLLQAEFERDGIHLDDTGLRKVRELNASIGQIEGQFQHNLYHSKDRVRITNKHSLFQLLDQTALQTGYGATVTSDATELPAKENTVLQTIFKHSPDPTLRKEVYMEYASSLSENVSLLEQLRRLRHELAETQGFQSFAHRTLTDRMAKTPEKVQQFLTRALTANQPLFANDMTKIQAAKTAVEGTRDPIEAWDTSFYVHLLQAKESQDAQAKVSAYLTLEKALETLQNLMGDLFDISMTEETMPKVERWDQSALETPSASTLLRKFVLTHSDQGVLGTLLLDLYPRESKFGHAAHYTVRCGCQWTNSKVTSSAEGDYQLPIVALVCNLSSNTGILSHGELETLFHEMGHAIHSILSRTKYQHVSGTRAAMDFVETPSQFFEQFAWDEHTLGVAFGVPEDCIQALTKSRSTLSSVDTQNQLLYSLFDQQLFGVEQQGEDSSILFRNLHSQLEIPYANNSHWYARFGHLVTYGAGYYGYMYSKGFAMELYRHVSQQGNGQSVWKKLLVYGGSKDPMVMLTDVLGRPPNV